MSHAQWSHMAGDCYIGQYGSTVCPLIPIHMPMFPSFITLIHAFKMVLSGFGFHAGRGCVLLTCGPQLQLQTSHREGAHLGNEGTCVPWALSKSGMWRPMWRRWPGLYTLASAERANQQGWWFPGAQRGPWSGEPFSPLGQFLISPESILPVSISASTTEGLTP